MNSSSPPQSLVVGSFWPERSTKDFAEIEFQRHAGKTGFSAVEWTQSTAVTTTFGFMCDHDLHEPDEDRWCTCRVLVKVARSGAVYGAAVQPSTVHCCLEHNHELTRREDKRKKLAKDAEGFVKQAKARILQQAEVEFKQIKAREGFRTGYENEDVDLSDSWRQAQLRMVEDVRRAVGESAARKLVWEMKRAKLLVAKYPLPQGYRRPSPSGSLSSALSSVSTAGKASSSSSDSSSGSDSDSDEEAGDETIETAVTSASCEPVTLLRRPYVETLRPSASRSPARSPPPKKQALSPLPPPPRASTSLASTSRSTSEIVRIKQEPSPPPPPAPRTLSASTSSSSCRSVPAPSTTATSYTHSLSPRPPATLRRSSTSTSISTSTTAASKKRPRDSAQSYLPLPPPPRQTEATPSSSSAFIQTSLHPFLLTLFPPTAPDAASFDLTSLAQTLVKVGVRSVGDVAMLLLMEKRALREVIKAYQLQAGEGGEGHEGAKGSLELAEIFHRARTAWEDMVAEGGER